MRRFSLLGFLIFLTSTLIAQSVDQGSLFPASVGALSYRRLSSDKPGQNGEIVMLYTYSHPGDDWHSHPQMSIQITKFNPQWEVVTREMADQHHNQGGAYTFQVANWPVSLSASNDQFIMFGASKNNFAVSISVSGTESSSQAQALATQAFGIILPKITEPLSSHTTSGGRSPGSGGGQAPGATKPGESGQPQYKSHREMLKAADKEREERERKQSMDRAYEQFQEDQNKAIAASYEAGAAMGNLYREGAASALEEGNTVAHRIEIIPPSNRLVLFREVDHRFGIGLANRSSHQITDVKIDLYAHTESGRKKIASRSVTSVLGGDLENAPFEIPHRSLYRMIDALTSTDLVIEARYKIKWNKAYFSSETKSQDWSNALNPRKDGVASDEEAAAAPPPVVLMELVDDTGNSLATKELLPDKVYTMKFQISSPGEMNSYLAGYDKPQWDPKPGSVVYSGWVEGNTRKPPGDMAMDRFDQRSNKRFSGKLGSRPVYFYARFKSPGTDDDRPFQVSLPVKYSSEPNLAGNEEYWQGTTVPSEFTLIRGHTEIDLSDLVKLNVTELNRQSGVRVGLTFPGGRVGSYAGDIVWMKPTDRWWSKDLARWIKLNDKLADMDMTEDVEVAGEQQMAADVVNTYDKQLGQTLSLCFSAENVIKAESESEIIAETGKAVIGAFVPMSGVVLPILETASLWYPREAEEKQLAAEASRAQPDNPFLRATLFTSPNDLEGDRIFFKLIDNTLYAIKLGETSR